MEVFDILFNVKMFQEAVIFVVNRYLMKEVCIVF